MSEQHSHTEDVTMENSGENHAEHHCRCRHKKQGRGHEHGHEQAHHHCHGRGHEQGQHAHHRHGADSLHEAAESGREEGGHSHAHPHDHSQAHSHHHEQPHSHHHSQHGAKDKGRHAKTKILVIRPYTGISGDIMVAGLARMLDDGTEKLAEFIDAIGLEELKDCLRIEPHSLNHIAGWRCRVTLPHEHSHRSFADILKIIHAGKLSEGAKALAEKTFSILAEAEGAVHGKAPEEVTFHEVGALDSILDICLAAALFDELKPDRLVCGPLPLCDGEVYCAHGKIPVPAPAVMRLLPGVTVKGIASTGETLTPTGIALLKAFDADFALWPTMSIEKECLVYGTRVFENVANGTIFAWGTN